MENNTFNTNSLVELLYENFVDEMISSPLIYRTYNEDIENAININNNIVSQLSNIRRHLESDTLNTINPRTRVNSFQSFLNRNFLTNPSSSFYYFVSEIFDIDSEINFDMQNMEDVKITLPIEEFNKYPVHIAGQNEHEKECYICLEKYIENEELTTLPCNHVFHKHCIQTWLCKEHITCPTCRVDIRNT
jgi:hypothetical protein